jgi:hypothetical protein
VAPPTGPAYGVRLPGFIEWRVREAKVILLAAALALLAAGCVIGVIVDRFVG